MFLFTFFRCRSFSSWWQLAFPLFLTAAIKFLRFFFRRNWSPLVFISRSSSLSVIHVNVDIEIKSKERIGFCCCCCFVLSLKGREAMRFAAETRRCLKHQISSGLHEEMDVRTDDFLRTKISCIHRFNKFSYPWCSAGCASRARELRYYLTSVSRVQIIIKSSTNISWYFHSRRPV